MSQKFNTNALKQQISLWLKDKDSILDDFYQDDNGNPLAEQDLKALKHAFVNGEKWSRETKHRLNNSEIYEDRESILDVDGMSDFDICHVDKEALASLSDVDVKRCICRIFIPKHDQLADNWRFEIVTSPDDTKIIAYALIVD